jgi:site-specific DNA-methyltransferase (adenine-specific)
VSDTLLLLGDCIERLRALPDASIDACVTDPPYDLTSGGAKGFMGKEWDGTGVAFRADLWREVLRVLKPGGYLLAFGGTRTYHRMTTAIEDAGAEIRDCIMYVYGSGFPKSTNGPWGGTALKPAWEPIVVARKPPIGTLAANVTAHGTGGMNIDGCRVPGGEGYAEEVARNIAAFARVQEQTPGWKNSSPYKPNVEGALLGRWPANVVLSHAGACEDGACVEGCPVATMNAQQDGAARYFNTFAWDADDFPPFLYTAKASRREREAGLHAGNMLCACEATRAEWDAEDRAVVRVCPRCGKRDRKPGAHDAVEREEGSAGMNSPRAGAGRTAKNGVWGSHPTVKPVSIMAWCIRLVCRKGGVVLDPFMGSGSTGIGAVREGVNFIGIEREAEYMAIAEARIAHAKAGR